MVIATEENLDELCQSFDNKTALGILTFIPSKLQVGARPKEIEEYLQNFMNINTSRTTVYNYCREMAEKGLLERLLINKRETRYRITKLGVRVRSYLMGDDFMDFYKSTLLIKFLARYPNLSKDEIMEKLSDTMKTMDGLLEKLHDGKLAEALLEEKQKTIK